VLLLWLARARAQAYRDYEVNKLETIKLALVKLSVIESIICEYQEEVRAAAAALSPFATVTLTFRTAAVAGGTGPTDGQGVCGGDGDV